jgi:hypothetical protein
METWKIVVDVPEAHTINYTNFLHSKKFFAVDASGSTSGSIINQERNFVEAVHGEYPNPADTVSLWGWTCDRPSRDFDFPAWQSNHGGTDPTTILAGPALQAIEESDTWFLLTDGDVSDSSVHRLAKMALERGILNVPLVFLITGPCHGSPATANISVGVSFFASSQDTLILFKETQTGRIFVIAGKGCFIGLGGSAAARDLTNWSDLRSFDSERSFFKFLEKLDINILTAESRVYHPKGISLGPEWEKKQNGPVVVDLDLILGYGMLNDDDLFDVLAEEAFDTLAVACKTRSRIPDLRTLIRNQKIEQVVPKLEDVNGATALLSQLGDPATAGERREVLQEQLREAHVKNREHYHNTIAKFAGSPVEQRMKKRNKLVDVALQSLASIEAAEFNAEILGRRSNRARRAEVVDSVAAIDVTRLDLGAPAFKGFCVVCCGEEEILSICLKKPDSGRVVDNTSNFALNFPLAAGANEGNVELVSSQNICFQCALLNPTGNSIYNESVAAIIPTVQYKNSNKFYINDQLYSALTSRLSTGAAGIAQLFMAILHEVLSTKSWAKAGPETAQTTSNHLDEATQRQKTFEWMLNQLIQNTQTRETFNEAGEWVKFPEALTWAVKDFEANNLASFVVTYPAKGFGNMITFGKITGTFSDATVRQLKAAKSIHSVAAKYLADLLQNCHAPRGWKQKYLEALYHEFNGPLIPRDQGSASLLTDTEIFTQRLGVCLDQTPLPYITLSYTDQMILTSKLQVLLFWLIFKQKNHCSAQTFFMQMRETSPIAHAVLSPTLRISERDHSQILLSLFATEDAQPIEPTAAAAHDCIIPFANPFGASVLHCGAPTCRAPFSTLTSEDELTPSACDAIRTARAQHLIAVFGVQGRFEKSRTGLPERPNLHKGAPPSSLHFSLHIAIVREWVKQGVDARRGIVTDSKARAAFVVRVCEQVCASGRGDIFNASLQRRMHELLPSFFDVLAMALRIEGRDAVDVADYEPDFAKNGLEDKIRWEMRAGGM